MGDTITKKDLEEILDKKFGQYQAAIIEAVDYKFQKVDDEISGLRQEIRRLTTTLDNFLKRLTDHEDEFKILKAEVDQIKAVFKEKFNIEIVL